MSYSDEDDESCCKSCGCPNASADDPGHCCLCGGWHKEPNICQLPFEEQRGPQDGNMFQRHLRRQLTALNKQTAALEKERFKVN